MAPLQNLKNEKGSALIEGILSFSIFGIGAGICFGLNYILIVQMWLILQGHLGLICVAEERPKSECEASLRKNAQVVLKFGRVETVQFYGNPRELQKLKIIWTVQKHRFQIHQSVHWKKILAKRDL